MLQLTLEKCLEVVNKQCPASAPEVKINLANNLLKRCIKYNVSINYAWINQENLPL